MTGNAGDDVRALYETFPYPNPALGERLIHDVANMVAFIFPKEALAGKQVLDAGCGTGQRLLALAKAFPQTSFVGIDIANASLETARALATAHHIQNVRFDRMDILSCRLKEKFDLIVSTGVIHHLVDPARGLDNLCSHLAHDGAIVLWLYHAYGEFDRLLDRDLIHTLWDERSESLQDGLDVMQALGVSLARERYSGTFAKRDNEVLDEISMNADAFLHPVVNAYLFADALNLLARCRMHWAAVHSINIGNASHLVDLAEASQNAVRIFCLKTSELFPSASLRERFNKLDNRNKLKAVELKMKPTGFTLIAGRHPSHIPFDARIKGNSVDLT